MTERKPVVRLFFAKMKQAFFDLPEDERAEFMRKDRGNLDALGMKAVSMINCSEFTSEWDYIGVEEWPSPDAIRERERFESDELEISKLVDYRTYQGAPESFDDYGKAECLPEVRFWPEAFSQGNRREHVVSRTALQVVNVTLALLTLFLGGASLLFGVESPIYPDDLALLPILDSNLRFLGGLGVGLGVALLWITPAIEKHGTIFRVLWLCALAGGIGRIISAVIVGLPPAPVLAFTAIEVPGVPLLIYWQSKVAAAAP